MTPFAIVAIQSTLTMLITTAITLWYIAPSLQTRSLAARLQPLLLVHAFRFVPLMLLLPDQVGPDFPTDLAFLIAMGDFVACLFAIAAILVWRYAPGFGVAATWVFSLIGTADMFVVLIAAAKAQVWNLPLGFIYVIPVFYVPVLGVFQALIFVWLIKRRAA